MLGNKSITSHKPSSSSYDNAEKKIVKFNGVSLSLRCVSCLNCRLIDRCKRLAGLYSFTKKNFQFSKKTNGSFRTNYSSVSLTKQATNKPNSLSSIYKHKLSNYTNRYNSFKEMLFRKISFSTNKKTYSWTSNKIMSNSSRQSCKCIWS